MAKVVITEVTTMVDGQPYTAFDNSFTRNWYVVKGTTSSDQVVMTGIKARNGEQALLYWLDNKNQ